MRLQIFVGELEENMSIYFSFHLIMGLAPKISGNVFRRMMWVGRSYCFFLYLNWVILYFENPFINIISLVPHSSPSM